MKYIVVDSVWVGGPQDDEDDPANWREERIPAKYEICERCDGEGKHTNPAIDGRGLSREDFDELGEEFEEDYFAGRYDIRCEECKGERVVLVPDRERADPESLKKWDEQQEEDWRSDEMYRMEMRAEYGPEYMW